MQKLEFRVTVSKTALGIQVMKDRSVNLSAQQRSALILCDGKRSAEEVVRMTSAVGVSLQDIQALMALGLVDQAASANPVAVAPIASTAAFSPQSVPAGIGVAPAAQAENAASVDYSAALNAAITLCSNLGFKGFGLNMALTGVDSLEKLQKLAPEIRRVAGDTKYKALHEAIYGKPL
jgi:hypothetical protein